ncbi:MAG: hypothetical protein M3Y76_12955 [Chloroflexota bacterium]|nr:hypothetical protein [Chloroflexota bacterium]
MSRYEDAFIAAHAWGIFWWWSGYCIDTMVKVGQVCQAGQGQAPIHLT